MWNREIEKNLAEWKVEKGKKKKNTWLYEAWVLERSTRF